ncbi:FAD/NAD(P)-binding domain-containing protein [Mycena crocata]|nr:FAD/NAD(P)-binding domain-containing protein [Mycena crocata]
MTTPHILIAGGGIVGLTLAHALKTRGIKATIFERDPDQGLRNQGWALSIHFGYNILLHYLSPEARDGVLKSSVDASVDFIDRNFDTIDARDLSLLHRLPVRGSHIRANRPKLRAVLCEGLDIHWGKQFKAYEITANGVVASFQDGSKYEGSMLIGCEGSLSPVRRQLVGPAAELYNLPIEGMAVIQTLPRAKMQPILKIDTLLFQAINPDTKTFLWHSVQGHDAETDTYDMLTYLSYPLEEASPFPQDASAAEIVANMKNRTGGFAPCLQDLVGGTGPEAFVTRVHLRDWIPVPYKSQGRIALAGDAGGAMVMYRGEGVNHGILDVALLAEAINEVYTRGGDAANLLDEYSEEVAARRKVYTMLSRDACIDAHGVVPPRSPLVKRDYPPPASLLKIRALHAAARKADDSENKF